MTKLKNNGVNVGLSFYAFFLQKKMIQTSNGSSRMVDHET